MHFPTPVETLEKLKEGELTKEQRKICKTPLRNDHYEVKWPFVGVTYWIRQFHYVRTKKEELLARSHAGPRPYDEVRLTQQGYYGPKLILPDARRSRRFPTWWAEQIYLLRVLLNNKLFKRTIL